MAAERVHLVNFYPSERLSQYPTVLSLGTSRLAIWLLSLGYESKLYSYSSENMNPSAILENEPDVIGFSIHYWDKQIALALLASLRKEGYHGDVLFGGPEASNLRLSNDQEKGRIFLFPDDGEIALQGYLQNRMQDAAHVQDIIWSSSVMQQTRELPLAVPLFSTEFDSVLTSDAQRSQKYTWYDTVRGCPYSCGYCDHGRGRRKPVEYDASILQQEIQNIGKYEEVFVVDPILGGGTKKKAKERLRLFEQHAPNTQLTFYLRPETVDDELIELIQNLKIRRIYVGIQTLNPSVPTWLRQNTLSAVSRLRTLAQAAPVTIELIVGLPGDTVSGLQQTLESVARDIQPREIAAYPLTVLDGTPLQKMLVPDQEQALKKEWITRDTSFKAIAAHSYTATEMQNMIRIAHGFTEGYNQCSR